MTCIVGIAHEGRVILGGDSAGVNDGWGRRIRLDPKVFERGDLLLGYTSSARMGQLLRYGLPILPPNVCDDDPHYVCVRHLVPAVRHVLIEGGYLSADAGSEIGGFLVGLRGRLFRVGPDFDVAENVDGYDAIGCGGDLALGAMHATLTEAPMVRLNAGLEAAAKFSAGVAGPFHFVTLEAQS